jgi:hypothetical protein
LLLITQLSSDLEQLESDLQVKIEAHTLGWWMAGYFKALDGQTFR